MDGKTADQARSVSRPKSALQYGMPEKPPARSQV